MRSPRRGACLQLGQGFRQDRGRKFGKTIVESASGFICGDGNGLRQNDVASVQFAHHVHRSDPCFTICGINGGLDASGTAETRQQRCMEIDNRLAGEGENALPQDLAVGHDDQNLRFHGGQFPGNITDFLGLKYGDAGCQCLHFDRGRRERLMTADGFVRLRHQGDRARTLFQ